MQSGLFFIYASEQPLSRAEAIKPVLRQLVIYSTTVNSSRDGYLAE